MAARSVREALTDAPQATLSCVLDSGALNLNLTREQLETLTRPLVDRTLAALRKVLRDARVQRGDVVGVVMVGGATRMPAVRRAVGEFFGPDGGAGC